METTRIIFAGNYHAENNHILAIADYMDTISIAGIIENGESTISYYKTLQPKAIFVDAYMDGLTGFEVARFIKEQDSEIKIIIVSEKFNHDFLNLSLEMDLDGYLPKNSKGELISKTLGNISKQQKYFDVIIDRARSKE